MFSYEGVGKNIEQAIENALFELKASKEDVDIKILSEGGLFKKAKVLVSISDDVKEKYQKKNKKTEVKEEDLVLNVKDLFKKEENREKVKTTKDDESKIKKIIIDDEISENEILIKEPEFKTAVVRERKMTSLEFVKNLLAVCGKECVIKDEKVDGGTLISVSGENLNELIGHRGECLFAISYLSSLFSDRNERVRVDIENYRTKLEDTLRSLARRVADKVLETGRYAKLEPMDASERRIIHLALEKNDKIVTTSKGTEPHRFIIIDIKR